MRIVVDVCLSPLWIPVLVAAGIESIHWSEVGLRTSEDQAILEWALLNDHIVFSHDLDFGAILAVTNAQGPSVIQLREQDTDPDVVGHAVVDAIRQFEPQLLEGALVTVDLRRSKVRILPLRRT